MRVTIKLSQFLINWAFKTKKSRLLSEILDVGLNFNKKGTYNFYRFRESSYNITITTQVFFNSNIQIVKGIQAYG